MSETRDKEMKELYPPFMLLSSYSAMCPVCGVISNIYPCYSEGEDTAAPHRLTYCNHRLERNKCPVLQLKGVRDENNR